MTLDGFREIDDFLGFSRSAEISATLNQPDQYDDKDYGPDE
jgi:hypothetical protein